MNKIELRDTAGLSHAYQIAETLILRTNEGSVYSIEVGETLLGSAQSAFGGKVTLQANPPISIGFCEGASAQEVIQAAEGLIANTPIEQKSSGPIPKPHIKAGSRVNA